MLFNLREKAVAKKSYQKPAFRFDRVFETRALSCGKVNITPAADIPTINRPAKTTALANKIMAASHLPVCV